MTLEEFVWYLFLIEFPNVVAESFICPETGEKILVPKKGEKTYECPSNCKDHCPCPKGGSD